MAITEEEKWYAKLILANINGLHGPKLLNTEILHYIYSQRTQVFLFTTEETVVWFRDCN